MIGTLIQPDIPAPTQGLSSNAMQSPQPTLTTPVAVPAFHPTNIPAQVRRLREASFYLARDLQCPEAGPNQSIPMQQTIESFDNAVATIIRRAASTARNDRWLAIENSKCGIRPGLYTHASLSRRVQRRATCHNPIHPHRSRSASGSPVLCPVARQAL